MKIAVINETSAADRNADILRALADRGHEIINAGMKKNGEQPELTYLHTGLLAALLLNTGRVEYVVGGCGTGQGFLTSVMQYPNIFCGHIVTALDAWLFTQINGGNCISLMLNQGYGWASDVNLGFIFDRIFSVPVGLGYPPHRQASQQESRRVLMGISTITHRPLAAIVREMPSDVVRQTLNYPGVWELLNVETLTDRELAAALVARKE